MKNITHNLNTTPILTDIIILGIGSLVFGNVLYNYYNNYNDNTKLSITKNDKNDVIYSLQMPEENVTKVITPNIINMYKPIGMASDKLDKIDNVMKELQ